MNVSVENLVFSYRSDPILNGVDINVGRGEIVGLLGPNGSGKSTLIKNVLGFLKPNSGRVTFSNVGENATLSAGDIARLVAFVPQLTTLRATITVFEAVLMGRLPHITDRWGGYGTEDREKALAVIESIGLSHLMHREVPTLSGGEMQKVIIARCLVQESNVLLLDEATSGLDINHAVEIMEILRGKADDQGKCILTVLHDINLAAQFCDRLFLLKGGTVYRSGPPDAVLTRDVVRDVYGIDAIVMFDADGTPIVVPRRSAAGIGIKEAAGV